MIIGAQLYSVCKQCRTPENIKATLTAMKEMGYTSVQVSGFRYDAEEFRAWADELGLHIGLSHTSVDEIINNTDEVIRKHKILGADMVGIGSPGPQYSNFETHEIKIEEMMRDLAPAVKKIQDAGLLFGYHNHYFEFDDLGGYTFMDYLYENTNWMFILDIGWVDFTGTDVTQIIKKYHDRLKYVHLKDFRAEQEGDDGIVDRIVPLYKGEVDFDKIIPVLEEYSNCEIAYVEQDNATNAENPYGEMKTSIDALRAHGHI